MPAGDLFQINVVYSSTDRQLMTGFAFRQTNSDTYDDPCEIVANAFDTDIGAALLDCWTVGVTLQCIICRRVAPGGAIPFTINRLSANGTIASPTLPVNSPLVCHLRTDSVSSKDNGRYYLSGQGETNMTAGIWNAAYINTPITDLNDLLLANIQEGAANFIGVWCVLNRVDAGVPITPPTSNDVTIATPRTRPASQRRRTTRQTRLT